MKTLIVCFVAAVSAVGAAAAPLVYRPPPETAELAKGPNVEVAEGYCSSCHSVDYITTQPRRHADPAAFWTAEVGKMQKAYGARLTDGDKEKVVAYLAQVYP